MLEWLRELRRILSWLRLKEPLSRRLVECTPLVTLLLLRNGLRTTILHELSPASSAGVITFLAYSDRSNLILTRIVLIIISLIVARRISFTDQLLLRVRLDSHGVSVPAHLVVAVLGSLVMDHLRLVLKHRNDFSAVVALVYFFGVYVSVWGALLLVNLNDLLLLLHCGIWSRIKASLHISLNIILNRSSSLMVLNKKLLRMSNRYLFILKLWFQLRHPWIRRQDNRATLTYFHGVFP